MNPHEFLYVGLALVVVFQAGIYAHNRYRGRMELLESLLATAASRLGKVDERLDSVEAEIYNLRLKVARLEGLDSVVNAKRRAS